MIGMAIVNYAKHLADVMNQSDIVDTMDAVRSSLLETTPIYETASIDSSAIKMQSKYGIAFIESYNKSVKKPSSVHPFTDILSVLKMIDTNISPNGSVNELLNKSTALNLNITKDTISFRTTVTMQYLSMCGFIVDYARQNLLFILAAEANITTKTFAENAIRPPYEMKWLLSNTNAFYACINAVRKYGVNMGETIEQVPDDEMTEDGLDRQLAMVPINKIDPLSMGNMPDSANLFYRIGVWKANRLAKKLNRAKQERKAVELRLEQLRQLRNNEQDPTLEDTIEKYEDMVNRLAKEVTDMESMYA